MQEHRIGQCYVRFEPPDVLVEVITDELTSAEVRELMTAAAGFVRDKRDVFAIVDVSRLSRLSSEDRKVGMELAAGASLAGIAIVGASFHIRVVAMLVIKAMRLLQRKAYEFQFFDADAQARAWIADLRRKRSPRPAEAAGKGR